MNLNIRYKCTNMESISSNLLSVTLSPNEDDQLTTVTVSKPFVIVLTSAQARAFSVGKEYRLDFIPIETILVPDAPVVPEEVVTDILFTDTDADAGEIGGTVSWNSPTDVTNITHYAVYTSTNGTTRVTKIGEVAVGNSNFVIPQGTPSVGVTHLAVYAKNVVGEAETGTYVAITDVIPVPTVPADVVSAVTFTDTDTDPNQIGGSISWTPPASVVNVTNYVVYTSTNGTTRATLLGEVAVGTNNFTIPDGTPSAGVTHLAVYAKNAVGEAATGIYEALTDVTA